MKRICHLLPLAILLSLALAPSAAQAPPRRGMGAAPDPLAAPARIRATLTRLGLPAMGPGHASAALLRARNHYAPGLYNVKFGPSADRVAKDAIHRRAGARFVDAIPELGIETVRIPDAAVDLYRKDPRVLWIEPDAMRYPLSLTPNDPAYNDFDYNLPLFPEDATWYKWDAHLIQAADGWGIWPAKFFTAAGKGTAGVKIAIIDTGVDYTHPDFMNAGGSTTNVTGGGQLYRSLDRTIFNGVTSLYAPDAFGHGTHVTGIAAAATNNGTGVTGNGYNANVISIRVTDANGNGTASDLASAITYAANNGAVVCNVSLGDYSYSKAEQDAVNYAWSKGMLVVAAAGNDGDTTPPPPIYPAALSRVLAASATTRDDSLASYASWGDWVGIGAPGGDFDFTIGWFLGVYSTTPTYYVTLNGPDYGLLNYYDYLMGSSMASPQVVGTAALYAGMKGWVKATPGAPRLLWQALQRGADGDGGWSPYFGWGRLNMYNTMNLALVPNPRGDNVGGIVGQVRYLGTPVLNADIVATPTAGGVQFSSSSRSDGGYRIPNVQAGTYNVAATYFGVTQTIYNLAIPAACDVPGADFNIGVPVLSSLAVSPTTVVGSKTAVGTVKLNSSAPAGGVSVALSTSNSAVAYPAVSSVTVPEGATSASFTIYTKAVSSSTSVVLYASAGGSKVSATITVRPISVSAISASPNPVAGSLNATGKVTLEAPAAPSNIVVNLASSNTAIAYLPVSSVTVLAGTSSATFTIKTNAVTTKTGVTITGSANGLSKSTTLYVRPIGPASVALSPNPVVGGNPVTGTVTLEAPAAPGSIIVTLTSSNMTLASLPVTSITIPAGQTTGTFTVNTTHPLATSTAVITASAGGVSKSATLTVSP